MTRHELWLHWQLRVCWCALSGLPGPFEARPGSEQPDKRMASVLSFALVLVAMLLFVVWQVRHHGCRGVTDAWVARQASMNRCAGACLLCEACFVEMCRVA